MYYVRHDNRQAKFADSKKAWAYAQTLKCDLDIYDSAEAEVIWGSYRLSNCETIEGKPAWLALGYGRTLAPLRTMFSELRPETWAISHYDWDSRSWVNTHNSDSRSEYRVYVNFDIDSADVPPFGKTHRSKAYSSFEEARAYADRVVERAVGDVILFQVIIVTIDADGNEQSVWQLRDE